MTAGIDEIVLLPGLDGTGRLFRWLLAEYAGPVPLRAVTYPPDPCLGYAELESFVEALIGTKRVVLLGESFSGPLAAGLAAKNPGQVKGLVLAATFVKRPWASWIMNLAARSDPGLAPKPLFKMLMRGRRPRPEIDAAIVEVLALLPPEVRAKRLQEVAKIEVRHRLQEIRCAVLVLHGRSDWLVPFGSIASVKRTLPDTEVVYLPCAHMLLQTEAREAARTIERFVRRIENAA